LSSADDITAWIRPLRFLRDRGPIYVAAPLADLIHALEAREQLPRFALWCVCESVEAIIRFLAIAGLAELATSGGLPEKVVKALRPMIERPTFGIWRAVLVQVVQALSGKAGLMPEVRSIQRVLAKLSGDMGRKDALDEHDIVHLRNALAQLSQLAG
jgi:hypothetical protein